MNAGSVVKVPKDISLDTACAAMLQGMTAHYLVASLYEIKDGDFALVHAGAGGVGQLLCQMITRVRSFAASCLLAVWCWLQ